MALTFHTFDPAARLLHAAPGTVESYPGGDIAVRHLQPAPSGQRPVAWNTGGTLDYAALAQWVCFHDQNSSWRPVLVMPYLPSARGDHDVTRDAQTAARLTAATGIGEVVAADPHSPAWAASAAEWGTAVHSVTVTDLVAPLAESGWHAVIAPDKGARERAGAVAESLGVPLLTAGKVRDPQTGALSGFSAPEGIGPGRYLVVDDICDGGGTFAGLARQIRATQPAAELHLWVTHGLFTGRWRDNLMPNFASVTAANTTVGPDPDALPSGVLQVPLHPHVLTALADLSAALA